MSDDIRCERCQTLLAKRTAEGLEMTCQPRSEDEAFSQVVFTLAPETYSIRRIVIAGADGSTTEFRFRGEELNPRLESRLFVFQAPPGAEILEAGAR